MLNTIIFLCFFPKNHCLCSRDFPETYWKKTNLLGKDPPETECLLHFTLPDPPVGPSVQTLAMQLNIFQTHRTLFIFLQEIPEFPKNTVGVRQILRKYINGDADGICNISIKRDGAAIKSIVSRGE